MTRLEFCSLAAAVVVATIGLTPCRAAEVDPPVPLSLSEAVTNQIDLRMLAEGEWELRTSGGDPFLEIPLPELEDPSQTPVLAFEYFCPQGVTGIELRVRRADADWPPPIDGVPLDPAEGWVRAAWPLSPTGGTAWKAGDATRLRIDFGIQSGVTLRVRNLHPRPRTAEELQSLEEVARERERKAHRADEIAAYLESDFPASITMVAVGTESLRISGHRPPRRGEVWLAEVPLHGDAVRPGERAVVVRLDEATCDPDGRFAIDLPRHDSGRDRISSRWQIVEVASEAGSFTPLSHASYATDLSAIGDRRLAAPPRLKNAKGLGGISPVFGLDDLLELGVRHITVNVVVTGLLSDAPGDGREPFTHNGRQWWVNARRLIHTDQTLAFAAEHGITVAAIVLLPTGATDSIVHPESSRAGIYAMPNLDDAEAAEKYEAVLAMLAERYAGGPRGRIDHWIMHNEIDFGWTWTNMGQQPLEIYLESYVRSMRIAYLQARRFNPFAKVFISLTHHWNVPRDEQWKTYPPREILERLAQFTRAEGEFGWGLAHHPYPESLWNSRTWEDATVQDDFDTPRITMKNIDVLQRYIELPQMRDASGNVRPVLLSEQGYHTDGYGEATQRNQAAALLYTWERLRAIDCVIAYDYHRWVDAAEEGGLLLGLRTLPSKEHPAGEKKLGWEVYKAIGTEAESQWRKRLADVYP